MNDTTIEAKVDEFVNDNKGFTSVDIGNAIKTDGTWIANREVAAWLRRWTAPGNYGVTKVNVDLPDGGTAFLSVRDTDKHTIHQAGKILAGLGFEIVATGGTWRALRADAHAAMRRTEASPVSDSGRSGSTAASTASPCCTR